jgi:hypothetical protein
MSRFLGRIGVLLLVLTVATATSLLAGGITPKDLDRSYGFTCSGTAGGSPFTEIGQVACDGKDTCVGTGILNVGGTPFVTTVAGHYTLDPKGVGFITYDVSAGGVVLFQLPIQFVVMDNGREVRGMPVLPDYNVLCELKAQQ